MIPLTAFFKRHPFSPHFLQRQDLKPTLHSSLLLRLLVSFSLVSASHRSRCEHPTFPPFPPLAHPQTTALIQASRSRPLSFVSVAAAARTFEAAFATSVPQLAQVMLCFLFYLRSRQCSPPSRCSGAALVCRRRFAGQRHLRRGECRRVLLGVVV